ncbi:MAG: sulfotransferase, partial [Herpetosiphon sp.]|nr:sulfotransferase [Herpetosiphon sp.]
LIPADRLVEVRFEDLERDPANVVKTIYDSLNLPGLNQARAPMQRYLDQLGFYQKNKLSMDAALASKIEQAWGFAFDAWGYER